MTKKGGILRARGAQTLITPDNRGTKTWGGDRRRAQDFEESAFGDFDYEI